MNNKFTYIVMFYFGTRMVTQRVPRYADALLQNKFYFAEKQIEFLTAYPNDDLEKVIFVVNQTPQDNINEIVSFFKSRTQELVNKTKFSFLLRDNKAISYGAWNDAIIDDLKDNDSETSYYFCLEDDYLPTTNDFVQPFIERCSEVNPYVCCLARHNEQPDIRSYASISNGLFLKSACRKVYDTNGYVFSLFYEETYTYTSACDNQMRFYKSFLDMGYNMVDILDAYYVPFFESDNATIKTFGNPYNPTLIEPILI